MTSQITWYVFLLHILWCFLTEMHCRSSSQRSPSQQLSVETSAENMQISSFNQRGEVFTFFIKDSHPLVNFSDDVFEFQILTEDG